MFFFDSMNKKWTSNSYQIICNFPNKQFGTKIYTLLHWNSLETHFSQKKISENIQKYTFIYP